MISLFIITAQRIQLIGVWGETTASQEAREFFDFLHPELKKKVEPILDKSEKYDIPTMISSLSGVVDKQILSLLNVSLYMKYFNPAAISKNNVSKSNVTLRGWGAFAKREELQMGNDYGLRILHKALSKPTFDEKIQTLANITQNLPKYQTEIQSSPKISNAQFYTHFPSNISFSSVNGRIASTDPHHVMDAIIQEYKNTRILESLNITEKKFLEEEPGRDVYHFTELATDGPALEIFNIFKERTKWKKSLVANDNYAQFLKYRENLVDVQMFLRVGSPLVAPLASLALDSVLNHKPFRFNMFLLGNMSDPVEAQWVTCFWRVCDDLGARNGFKFIIDATEIGLKKAFKNSLCSTRWKDVGRLLENNWIMTRVNKTNLYCDEKQIKDWGVSVNGEFIFDYPPFENLIERCLMTAKRIQDAMKRGLNTERVSFPSWFQSDSIVIDTMRPPLEITTSNRISLSNKRSDIVADGLLDLHKEMNNTNGTASVPVFTFGYKLPKLKISNTLICAREMGSMPYKVKELFGDIKTIIGPFVFGELNSKQIEYVVKRVNYTYHHHIKSLSLVQRHFVELWRADTDFINQKRSSRPRYFDGGVVRSRKSSVTWFIVSNPTLTDNWPLLELMKLLTHCELVAVEYLPIIGSLSIPTPLNIISGVYYPAFTQTFIDTNEKVTIMRSNRWNIQCEKGIWTVNGVIFSGYISKVKRICIGLELRKPFWNGYFAAILPPGKHPAQGFNLKFINVDSFISHDICYIPGNLAASKATSNSNNADIFTYALGPKSNMKLYSMLYTLFSNNTVKSRLFIIDPWISITHPNITIIYLPFYYPPFMPQPQTIVHQFKAAKYFYPGLLLPNSVDTIIYADESLIFRGDASRISRIDWKDAAAAAPHISTNTKLRSWNSWQMKTWTMGRPFHTCNYFVIKQSAWIEQRACERYINMSIFHSLSSSILGYGDEEYFNMLQLNVQIVTLPEETTFCSDYSRLTFASKAIAHVLCEEKSEKLLGTRPKKLYDEANKFFED